MLKWDWVDFEQRRVSWPDSKTGKITKPLSDEAYRLLSNASRFESYPPVCPSIFDPTKPMTNRIYHHGWQRILQRARIPHVGAHGIRHRAALRRTAPSSIILMSAFRRMTQLCTKAAISVS